MIPESFRGYVVDRVSADSKVVRGALVERPASDLADGDVVIAVRYSSLNYKDAMASRGHRGVVKALPHVPGIDAVGTVLESGTTGVEAGAEVLVTSYELGVERWGGWAGLVRVPDEWVVPLPSSLSAFEAMALGTAGLTAAQCVAALRHNRVDPESGPVVVTGSSGGVGSLAVAILARLGYEVWAVSGKADRADWLKDRGASEILSRDAIPQDASKPLASTRWAGAVDTVGGAILAGLIRATKPRGCVAACGVVAGAEVPTTVYPFILRGVTLAGIDSAWCPTDVRNALWDHLSTDWKPAFLDQIGQIVPLSEVETHVDQILQGQVIGRIVLDVNA